jgi:cobalt-zinc-cadmium efflux system protein
MGLHHHTTFKEGDGRLIFSVTINVVLTVAQVIGGIISGSLSLIADALHNLSDAGALLLALIARKIGRKSADYDNTYGYARAEVIGALINLVTLIIIGLYLVYEAIWRLFQPKIITGWTVVIVASIALAIDIVTAVLTYSMSKESLNVKAAFLHNISDALASVGVIIAGILIINYDLFIADTIITLLIAGYVLYQGLNTLPRVIRILMQSTPPDINIEDVIKHMEHIEYVSNIHHMHIWELDEHERALEAHVIVNTSDLACIDKIKHEIKCILHKNFYIAHSTLEFEFNVVGKETQCEDLSIVPPH